MSGAGLRRALWACLLLAVAAPSASAQSNSVPNGTYYGVSFPTTTIVAMSIRNNDIGPTTVFSQNFSYPLTGGLPQSFFPGANTTVLTNAGKAGRIATFEASSAGPYSPR